MDKPYRVLQVIGKMDSAGAENMIMNLYRKIDKTEIQFDFLVHSNDKGFFDDEIESLGGRIYRIRRFTGLNLFSYKKDCESFFAEHPEFKVVHGHIGSSAALYLGAAKKAGAFTIAHSHSALMRIRNVHDLFYKLFSYPTRYVADQLFACSRTAGLARFGSNAISLPKYREFANAIDLEKFYFNSARREIIRRKLGINPETIVIGSIGRITPPKNPYMLVEIFISIVKKSNVVCLWVGTGEMIDEIKKIISEAGVESKIIMMGVRNDVPDLLQGLDCFVFPSLWEGLPVSVIEAEVAGLPCVLSDTITKEVEITNQISWMSLCQTADEWANTCLKCARQNRIHRKSDMIAIEKSGYDINKTAKWLQDFYLEKY